MSNIIYIALFPYSLNFTAVNTTYKTILNIVQCFLRFWIKGMEKGCDFNDRKYSRNIICF